MDTNEKLMLGVGIAALLGGGLYLILRPAPKDKSGNPIVPVTGDPVASGDGDREEFDIYAEYILNKWEAKYVKNATEESLYAICKEWYPSEDIPNMPLQRAMDLIFRDYWVKYNIHKLPEHLRMVVLDAAINQGQPTSIRMLQACAGVSVDGKNGPVTQEAANKVTIDQYCAKRLEVYKISASKGNRSQYLAGWVNRLNDVCAEAKKE